MFDKIFDKIFGRSKKLRNTLEKIDLTKGRRVIELCEKDFNDTIYQLHHARIEAGNTITLTDPDGITLLFVIRKNKKNYDK